MVENSVKPSQDLNKLTNFKNRLICGLIFKMIVFKIIKSRFKLLNNDEIEESK